MLYYIDDAFWIWNKNGSTINKPHNWSFTYYYNLEVTGIKKPSSFDNELVEERFGDIFFRLRCCLNYMLVRTSSLQCCIVSENNRLIEYIDNGLLMMQIISLVSYTESMCVRMLHFMYLMWVSVSSTLIRKREYRFCFRSNHFLSS